MFINEIDLDLPYKQNSEYIQKYILLHNNSKEDAIFKDYEENWKQKRLLFRDEVRCIAEMYTYHLGKFETNNIKKVMINCVSLIENHEIVIIDGTVEVEVDFDIYTYLRLSNSEKKKVILNKIQVGILKVASKFHWESSLFQSVYNIICEKNYKNEYIWRKKYSPSRRYVGITFCIHDINTFEIFLIIKDKTTEVVLKKELIIRERPNEFAFVRHLGNLRWISENEVVLINKNKNKKWSIKL